MVDNVSAIQPSGSFQYIPASGLGYYDFDSIDMDYSMYPLGLGGSIFSGGCPMPYIMPWGSGMDTKSYFEQMKEYQKLYGQMNLEQQKRQRNADLQLNGAMESIEEGAKNLKDKIAHNEQDQISDAYKKYVDSVRRAYGEGNEEDINSRAMTMYERFRGKSLVQDLRDNGHSSFVQGVIQSLSFGLFSQKSSEDNIAEITGQTVHQGEKVEQNIGRVVGAIGAGAAGTAVLALAKQYSSTLATILKKVPMVSFIVAGLAAGLAFITGKATT
jgi:hypothetical protein